MLLDLLIIAIVCFAALAWGANEPWAMAIMAMISLALLLAHLMRQVWRGNVKLRRSWIYIPLLVLLGYVGLQLLWSRPDLDRGHLWLPHTVERSSTVLYLQLAAAYVALIFLVHNGFGTRARVKMLIISVLALGVFESLYGLSQYLGGYNYIWDYRVTADVARGTLINRNHYALLLNLSICAGVGYLYYRSMGILRGQTPTLRHIISSPGSAQIAWVILWLALIGMTVVFSMSRMGIVAMFGCVTMMIVTGKLSRTGKRATVLGLALLLVTMSLALYTGIDTVLARYESITSPGYLEKDRLPIWRDAWKLVEEQPLFGQGLASFQWTFPAFESVEPDVPARYAHNDYLQALAEVGVTGLFLLLWAFVICWRSAAHNFLQSRDPLARGIGLATLGILTAVTLQELTDFSLYIPGVAANFAVLVGLNLRASHLDEDLHSQS